MYSISPAQSAEEGMHNLGKRSKDEVRRVYDAAKGIVMEHRMCNIILIMI